MILLEDFDFFVNFETVENTIFFNTPNKKPRMVAFELMTEFQRS